MAEYSGTTPLIAPTVHLNGTSRESLMQSYHDAYATIEAALTMLGETAPHPRDYYVHPTPNAFDAAREQYTTRVRLLRSVQDELMFLYEAVEKQGQR